MFGSGWWLRHVIPTEATRSEAEWRNLAVRSFERHNSHGHGEISRLRSG